MVFGVVRALLKVEAQCRKPVLPVDDEELGLRLRQLADPSGAAAAWKRSFFRGKQQHSSRDRRLADLPSHRNS